MNISRLSLIGAGTGDSELITLKGIQVLAQADVVLYDALVNPLLLSHTQPNAELIFVGKRLRQAAYSQEQINRLIVDKALAGQHVVRLKGGDPLVFGRAIEEMEAAREFGIAVEVIPGVSSCIAVPAAAGIPVTARGVADSFWTLTGTTQTGELPSDMALAAQSSGTVVILMGMSKLAEICRLFVAAGKGDLPAAVIQNGTHEDQREVFGLVADLPQLVAEAGLGNPAVIVIGAVVALSPKYHLEVSDNQSI
jgi:uroporphyrin-III C-methyltransferase